MLGWIYLSWCCWHVCSCPGSVGAGLGQGMLQKMTVACVIMEFGNVDSPGQDLLPSNDLGP